MAKLEERGHEESRTHIPILYIHRYIYIHTYTDLVYNKRNISNQDRCPIHGVGTNDHVYGWKDINQILSSYVRYIKDLNNLFKTEI